MNMKYVCSLVMLVGLVCGISSIGFCDSELIENLEIIKIVNMEMRPQEKDGLYYNFQILGGCSVYIISSDMKEIVYVDNGQSKLECVWLAVVEFIKWYNNEVIN